MHRCDQRAGAISGPLRVLTYGVRGGASLLVNTSGATLTTGGPLTSRFRGYQGSEEGDDAETLTRIKINNNLGSA
ncbi:hypothetical protein RB195_006982 [Necator americanus]|uniref:Uncharacterized protein n=1 Tax=Necator americanus TaxID=51031 RepID=A0ABR1BYF4_NECAM